MTTNKTMTITKDPAAIACKEYRYHFIHEMKTPDAVARVMSYLYGCHKYYRDHPMQEIWDFGIGVCRDRLSALGCRHIPSLKGGGYPALIELPDGSIINPITGL